MAVIDSDDSEDRGSRSRVKLRESELPLHPTVLEDDPSRLHRRSGGTDTRGDFLPIPIWHRGLRSHIPLGLQGVFAYGAQQARVRSALRGSFFRAAHQHPKQA